MRVLQHIPMVFVAVVLAYSSCTKDKAAKPVEIPAPSVSNSVTAKVNSAICFPFDSCVVNFSLDIKGMSPPIQVTWLEPSYLSGSNDLNILLETDQKLKVRVEDAGSNLIVLDTVIRKSSFDSLVYDYRLPVLGKYFGIEQSSSMIFDGTTWVYTQGPELPSELEVLRDANFQAGFEGLAWAMAPSTARPSRSTIRSRSSSLTMKGGARST